MTPDDHAGQDGSEQSGDAVAVIETGHLRQRLVVEGWFASHADSGTPGPHVHLRTSDGQDAVLHTQQVPGLLTALKTVAERIDTMWVAHGDQYAADVVLKAPDPQDPRVAQQQLLRRLAFTQLILDNLPQVLELLTDASSTDEALVNIAALLNVEAADAMIELSRFDLLSLTRPATEQRLNVLAQPEG